MINGVIWKMEFRRSLKNLIIWGLVFGGYLLLTIVLYPLVKDMYAAMPDELLQYMDMMGGLPNNIVEYYAVEAAMMAQLGGAIFASIIGYSLLGHDEREATTDVVYSLPVSRQTQFLTRLCVLVTEIVIFSGIFIVLFSLTGIIAIERGMNLATFFRFHAFNTVLLLLMGMLGFSLAALSKRAVKPGLALLIPLFFYIVLLVSQLTNDKILKDLRYLTPYAFADPVGIIKKGEGMLIWTFCGWLAVTAVFLIVGLASFKRKEFIQ